MQYSCSMWVFLSSPEGTQKIGPRSGTEMTSLGLGPLSFASLGLSALAKHRRTRRLAGGDESHKLGEVE